ncbi:hypothetical protein [Serratia fonticola]|jgi:hypothetical protein
MGNDESSGYDSGNQGLGGLGGWANNNQGLNYLGSMMTPPLPAPPPLVLQPADHLWFNQKDIVLDGWRFSSCRFDQCRIFLNSQHFELINCMIDEKSVIYYQNHTINIIRLFNSRFGSQPFLHPHFNAYINNDGTISIVR